MTKSSRAPMDAARSCLQKILLGGFAILAVVSLCSPAGAAIEARDSVAFLKQLSLEELMELKVTSVSRHPEKLIDAASAIQVITGEAIRRSAASTLPEALRLASNLTVAQKNSHDWAISATVDLAGSDEQGVAVIRILAVGPLPP